MFINSKFRSCHPRTTGSQKRKEGFSALSPCRQLGTAVGVVLAMGEHPLVARKVDSVRLRPLAVIVGVSLDPTLEVVAVGGGKDFASGEVVSKMCHDFLSFSLGSSLPLCDYIISHFV